MDGLTKGIVATIVLVVLLVVGLMVFRTVDQGETCVVTTFGKVSHIAGPGLNMRWPLIQSFNCFSSRMLIYETSDVPGESRADFTDVVVEANTNDGQQMQVRYGISFHVDPDKAILVYTEVARDNHGLVERVVKFHSRSKVRLTLQEHKAGKLYSGDIVGVQTEIETQLRELFKADHITLDAFVLRKISFDPDYIASIEQQQISKENIETKSYDAQAAVYTAQETAALATGDANAEIERAKGHSESVKIQAAADAESINLRGESLKNYPQILSLEFFEALKTINWALVPWDQIAPFMPIPPTGLGQ